MKRSALARSDRKRPLLGKAIPAEGRPDPLLRTVAGTGGREEGESIRRNLGLVSEAGKRLSPVRPKAAWRFTFRHGPCILCRKHHHNCTGHHLLAQEHLRTHVAAMRLAPSQARRVLRNLISDCRNGVPLCPTCHERVENRSLPFPRSKIPLVAWQMAAELGEWATVRLEREYLETKMPLAPGPL